MAANSPPSAVPPVVPDQPPSAWPNWLREIAATINLLIGWANRPILMPTPFAGLPAEPMPGMLAHITDSSTTSPGGIISGGGSYRVCAWYNGENWTVLGD